MLPLLLRTEEKLAQHRARRENPDIHHEGTKKPERFDASMAVIATVADT
jgi:hypothetical protein